MNYLKTTLTIISTLLISISYCQIHAEKPLEVKPLLKSTWSQAAPFNEACPFGEKWGKTPPGCGAVAAGQILNRHRTLKKAYGIKAYYSLSKNNRRDSMLILKNFDECKFDWGNIRNTYSVYRQKRDYTDRQAKAVADYLSQVSIAMHTHYNTGGSTTTTNGVTLWGLHHHLHLSPKAVIRSRKHYTTEEWKNLINEQLVAGNPVYYAASHNEINSNGKQLRRGHAFVIDGINKDGKYHANFGHGGTNNQYVDLNVINYYSYEYPGSRHTCYGNNQRMITDFYQTATDTFYQARSLMITEPIVINNNKYQSEWIFTRGRKFSFTTYVENYNILNEEVQYTLGIFNNDTLMNILDIRPVEMPRIGERRIGTTCTVPTGLENGNYTVHLISRTQAHPRWEKAVECLPATLKMTVDNERVSLMLPPNRTLPSRLYLREPISEVKIPETNGKSFRLALKNPSENNFVSNLQLNITVNGESHSFLISASVYSGCEVDYHINIPKDALNLDNKEYKIEANYYEINERAYKALGLTEPTDEKASPENHAK